MFEEQWLLKSNGWVDCCSGSLEAGQRGSIQGFVYIHLHALSPPPCEEGERRLGLSGRLSKS